MFRRVELFIAACFYYSGLVKLARWWRQKAGQSLVILNYHYASGGDLRRQMLYLSRHYRILHLEAALEEIYTPSAIDPKRRDRRTPLVLTFDDGSHDHYTHAMALACELQIPITLFLIPGYIESGRRFWWLEADYLIQHAQVSEVTLEGRTYHLDKLDERQALTCAIDAHVRYAGSVSEREEFLASVRKVLAAPARVNAAEEPTLPLTWEEVRKLKDCAWISFGAHTMHHPILGYLTDTAEVQYEVSECRVVLEQQLGHPVRTFAYPVGKLEHIGENGIPAVQKAGYNWALTTIEGFNTPQTNPYFLHRPSVDVSQHWLLVAAKASGVWGFFSRRFWTIIILMRKYVERHTHQF